MQSPLWLQSWLLTDVSPIKSETVTCIPIVHSDTQPRWSSRHVWAPTSDSLYAVSLGRHRTLKLSFRGCCFVLLLTKILFVLFVAFAVRQSMCSLISNVFVIFSCFFWECFWVIDVEAHAPHFYRVAQNKTEVITHTWYLQHNTKQYTLKNLGGTKKSLSCGSEIVFFSSQNTSSQVSHVWYFDRGYYVRDI